MTTCFTLLRVDGTREAFTTPPTNALIRALLRADSLDSVSLTFTRDGRPDDIMCVDDTGLIDGKPLNPEATRLYHQRAPQATTGIHGDVVLTKDHYFA